MSALDDLRATMAAYGGGEKSPAILIVAALEASIAEVKATQTALSTQIASLPLGNVDDILLRAARKALLEAAPEAKRVQRWQRWSAVAGGSVVALCALLMVGVAWWRSAPVVVDAGNLSVQCNDPTHRFADKGGEACWMTGWVKPPPVAK